MESEMKPCPFCGAWAMLDQASLPDRPLAKRFFVTCYNEDCPISPQTMRYGNDEIAIAAWNTRASDWTPITPENLPDGERDYPRAYHWELYGCFANHHAIDVLGDPCSVNGDANPACDKWSANDYIAAGWTHFRPINPPAQVKP